LNLENYTVLGFDFRIPGDVPKTVDACLWERAEDLYQRLASSVCSENIAQLLECPVSTIEDNAQSDAIAVAIAVAPSGLEIMEGLFGGPFIENPHSPNLLIAQNWTLQGFDVADASGYFSVFGIDSGSPKLSIGKHLFANEAEAESFVKPATALYPSHAPFVVFAVLTYQRP
jgi:hypothetical protein